MGWLRWVGRSVFLGSLLVAGGAAVNQLLTRDGRLSWTAAYFALVFTVLGVLLDQLPARAHAQIQEFLNAWFRAIEHRAREGADRHETDRIAARGANDLLRRITDTPALLDLAANPLLLTMIANVRPRLQFTTMRTGQGIGQRRLSCWNRCELPKGGRRPATLRGRDKTRIPETVWLRSPHGSP